MAAPTNTADVKKTLANSEPSTHGTSAAELLTSRIIEIICRICAFYAQSFHNAHQGAG